MKTIHKYVLQLLAEETFDTPEVFVPLLVAEQNGHLCLWAEVTVPSARRVRRTFYVVGTGHSQDDLPLCRHVGSAVCPPYVWHVYQKQD